MSTNDTGPIPQVTLGIGNEECIYTELTSKLSRKFASYKAIENDLDTVITSLKFLIKKSGENKYSIKQHDQSYSEDQIIKLSVYRSAVVTSAKIFVEARGREKTKFNDSIFKDNQLKKIHRNLMSQRHNFHAHAGHSKYHSIIPIIAFKSATDKKPKLATISLNLQVESKDILKKYLKTVKSVLAHVQNKAQKCGDKLLKEEIRPNVDNLFSKATNSDK